MLVSVLIIGGGLGLLVGLAVLVAHARVEEAAWRRIAAARRELHEWEGALIAAAEGRGCPGCRLRQDGAE